MTGASLFPMDPFEIERTNVPGNFTEYGGPDTTLSVPHPEHVRSLLDKFASENADQYI